MVCPYPNCNKEISEEDKFCPICHQIIKKCIFCNTLNLNFATYCRHCGKKLTKLIDWPMAKGNAQLKTCCNGDGKFIKQGEPLIAVWKPILLDSEIYSSLISTEGLIFAALKEGGVAVLNQFSGKLLYKLEWENANEIYYSPSLSNKILVAGSKNSIAAFNLAQLNKLFKEKTISSMWIFDFSSSGELSKDLISSNDSIICSLFSEGTTIIYSLDVKSGTQKWKNPIVIKSKIGTPSLYQNQVIILISEDSIYAFSLKDGSQLWKSAIVSAGIKLSVDSIISGDYIYFFNNLGQLYTSRLSLSNVSKPKRVGTMQVSTVSNFSASKSEILISYGCGLIKTSLYGDEIWRSNIEAEGFLSSPLILKNIAIIGSGLGKIYVFNLKSSSCEYRTFLFAQDAIKANPIYSNNMVFLNSIDGKIGAFSWV